MEQEIFSVCHKTFKGRSKHLEEDGTDETKQELYGLHEKNRLSDGNTANHPNQSIPADFYFHLKS